MENICIPMHLDAFALSPDCCDGDSKIAPYTQPNYTALRLDSHLIQHDVLDHVDFHNTSPAPKNPRLADLGQKPPNNLKRNRMGIHLHWSLPRLYRAAIASAKKNPSVKTSEPTNPVFPKIPNRFLVTRHLANRKPTDPLPEFQSWVVESDAVRNITEIDETVDLESEVAPFVSYEGDPNQPDVLNAQTEIFLGQKFDLVGWSEAKAAKHRPLTLMNSSNPIFPDYALHNTNVLSVIDNFSFRKGANSPLQYVNQAQCDYFVIGWHSDPADDPLNKAANADLSSRLKQLMLQLSAGSVDQFGVKEDQTRCLVFGAIYAVKYNFDKKPTSLADKGAKNFIKDVKTDPLVKMEPLAVGTTPLDSILTFLDAHQKDADTIFQTEVGTGNTLAEDITSLAQFLYATADEYDARVQAQDILARQSYAKAEGGFRWTSANPPLPGGRPTIPTQDNIETLRSLNDAQTKLDASKRNLRSLQWELFAEWWKYVSEFIPDKQKLARNAFYTPIVANIVEAIRGKDGKSGIAQAILDLQAKIDGLNDPKSVKTSVKDPYYTRTDPTLTIAGLNSGRPQDFSNPLQVILDHELSDDSSVIDAIFAGAKNPVPDNNSLQLTARKLLAECLKNAGTQNGIAGTLNTTGFLAWNDQNPFVPLFIEWESIYYHIDINDWEVQLRSSPWGHNHSIVRYEPKKILYPPQDLSSKPDFRTLSGRVLVLPQPVFSLENIVMSILDNPPKGMELKEGEADFISTNIRKMKFISAPLSGLTSHLLTRCEGAHVKPVVRVQGEKIQPLAAAAKASSDIGIDSGVLQLVDGESALTPYGTLMAFGTDDYPKDKNPFKGVTHGQMIFTKINIVDKFGQGICLPPTTSRLRAATHPPKSTIYPCLSEFLAPDIIGTTVNTVYPISPAVGDQVPLCEYIQLTPSINQDTRINAAFLVRDKIEGQADKYSAWREASEYDQQTFGWIVINYADGGLQFFLADGTFYREIRKGGVKGATVSPKWLPNKPPTYLPTDAGTKQLDLLINELSPDKDENASFLQSFFDMINGSIVNMPFPPSDYSAYLNSIVGKPLALVNAGWSIELAAPAIKPQNTGGNRTADAQADLEAYSFPLKIGDIERSYDGVVGYWMAANNGPGPIDTASGTDWKMLHTYFVTQPSPKLADITLPGKGVFPELHPYYIDPMAANITSGDINDAHTSKYTVTTLLIDPYTPIHAFSPILPTKALTLPPWIIQQAFSKMHAFFHLGPILLTRDMPNSLAAAEAADPTTGAKQVVKLPVSGRKGTWAWFQPYATPTAGELEPEYAQIDVQEDVGAGVGSRFGAEPAPYTFVEGFLQLMGSLQGQDVKAGLKT